MIQLKVEGLAQVKDGVVNNNYNKKPGEQNLGRNYARNYRSRNSDPNYTLQPLYNLNYFQDQHLNTFQYQGVYVSKK